MDVLAVGSDVIETTREHSFWVVGSGWIEAKDLQVGYMLVALDGDILRSMTWIRIGGKDPLMAVEGYLETDLV